MGDAARKHKSLFGRAKRALTTKTVGLKAGRKAITKIVGDEGAEMITAVKAAISLHYGHERGKASKIAIMKLAAKVKYLADEGLLVEENTKPAVEPLNALGLQLLFFAQSNSPLEIARLDRRSRRQRAFTGQIRPQTTR
eukprot:GABV01008815.1.p1 GENE.GABV01008815.1~~GABV01008815.1.p1  ORF type:complete len:139 (-),score=45.99 GABV01008815.1:513-929(-)